MTEQQQELLKLMREGHAIPNELLEDMHAVDIALAMEEGEATEEMLYAFFKQTDTERLAAVLEVAGEDLQAKIVNLLDYSEVIQIFSYMSKDDIADILGNLPINLRKKLLNLMKLSDSREINILLGYGEDTAGGIMTTEYIALYEELTIAKALEKIKQIAPRTEVIEYIFALSRRGELTGIADLRDILVAPYEETLKDIMETNFISVYPEQDQEEVSHLVNKYSLSVIPVINKRSALLGIITSDDILDVLVEEQTEDILKMGGVGEDEEIGGPILKSVTRRLPWLVINLFTAFIAASAISVFDRMIAQVAALASMMTIVSGMGGNSGSQVLSLTIRGITLGEIDLKKDFSLVFREILLGMLNGACVGTLTAIVMGLRYQNIYLGLVILLALICNLVIAGIAGFLIPLIIKKIGGDPALASSIFLTTMTDTGGFFIFLGLASLFLKYL